MSSISVTTPRVLEIVMCRDVPISSFLDGKVPPLDIAMARHRPQRRACKSLQNVIALKEEWNRPSHLVSKGVMSSFLFIMIASGLAGDAVPAPPTIPREKGTVAVSAGGGNAERWTADWTMEPFREQGRPALRFTEIGHGQYSGYSQPVRW